MKEMKGRQLLLVGFTLFSMFFGAGNLIFPPFLGAQAGNHSWLAFSGFALSAIGFPILGVVAVARSGGLPRLAGRAGGTFSAVFTLFIYLSIGPCLAIPRTASTSFEMAVTPFLSDGAGNRLLPLCYSLIFFAVAFLLALHPEKLTDRLGKVLCPVLLALILAIFLSCILHPVGEYAGAESAYEAHPWVQGFLDGYQTMDTIAALNFGIVVALNIRAKGIEEERSVVRTTIRAGWIAGGVLLAVYAMLTHIGALSGGAFPGASNGAETLTRLVNALFGRWGSVLLAAIFVIACLNTCVSLLSCCGEYFAEKFSKVGNHRISYRQWTAFFALVSVLIANLGLNQILKVSLPVLSALYPVAIVLILLSLFQRWLEGRRFVYSIAVLFTGAASVFYALTQAGLFSQPVRTLFMRLPLAAAGLGWLIPAAVGIALGLALSLLAPRKDAHIDK